MAYRHTLVWTLALAAALAACGDDSGGDDDDGTTPTIDAATPEPDASTTLIPENLPDSLPQGPVDVKVGTYNVGLVSLLKFNEQRKPLGVAALEALGTDGGVEVLCLQEVFLEFTSGEEYASLLEDVFPYAFWSETGETSYGNGLLIVSKHPLYRGREIWFQGDGGPVDRMVIAADVVTDDSYFHVACGHLEPFSLELINEEIAKVEQFVTDLGYQDDPFIFLGDFNTGPNVGCCDAEVCTVSSDCPGGAVCAAPLAEQCPEDQPENQCLCEALSEEPWENLLTFWSDGMAGFPAADACTYCQVPSRALQLLPPSELQAERRIDGCLYRNLEGSSTLAAEIVLDELYTYEAGGEQQTTQASDHQGVTCTFGQANRSAL